MYAFAVQMNESWVAEAELEVTACQTLAVEF